MSEKQQKEWEREVRELQRTHSHAELAKKLVAKRVECARLRAEQPAVPEGWSVEQHGSMYLVREYDSSGELLKGVWVNPDHHGHVICEMLSEMQQGGREL